MTKPRFNGLEEERMSALERICPNCGTPNSAERTHCVRCNTNLVTLAARGQTNLPARLDKAQATALALGVTALIARAGFNLLTREILPRVINGSAMKRASSLRKQPASDDRPDYIIRGWRGWTINRGGEHSSGSEQFEWRIKRSK